MCFSSSLKMRSLTRSSTLQSNVRPRIPCAAAKLSAIPSTITSAAHTTFFAQSSNQALIFTCVILVPWVSMAMETQAERFLKAILTSRFLAVGSRTSFTLPIPVQSTTQPNASMRCYSSFTTKMTAFELQTCIRASFGVRTHRKLSKMTGWSTASTMMETTELC